MRYGTLAATVSVIGLAAVAIVPLYCLLLSYGPDGRMSRPVRGEELVVPILPLVVFLLAALAGMKSAKAQRLIAVTAGVIALLIVGTECVELLNPYDPGSGVALGGTGA